MKAALSALAVFLFMASYGLASAVGTTSCVGCHGNPDVFDGEMFAIVEQWRGSVHAEAQIDCQDCHGGNPDPALAEDSDGAMDRGFKPNPYVGRPERQAIPAFCGRCHSDPEFMKRYNPAARVDQVQEYWTSHHGRALQRGDTRVATCIDCHGIHGILHAGDTRSPVYPKQVAETCGRCHSDSQRMAGSTTPDGRPLPVDQQARWRRSVHAAALYDRDDLSAPTCNDCHGNHGATPPGLDSIAFVCGQCHGREAGVFRTSAKQAGFRDHNELLEDGSSCSACHEPPDPAAELQTVHAFSECVTCHGNHSVVRPTLSMLEPLPATPCAFCHEALGLFTEAVPEPAKRRQRFQQVLESLLLDCAPLEGEELFNELVRRAQQLEFHTQPSDVDGSGERVLRPEFERLFTKFRIGTTTFSYVDPTSGQEIVERVVRCGDCHAAQPLLADRPNGLRASRDLLEGMRQLTGLTARAERIMLAARRGGVEVRDALGDIDQAVNAQIELEVLVHSFAADEGSAFATKRAEGLEHASAALRSGQHALDELRYRRSGLVVSLAIIALVLVGIALKIRQLGSPE